MSIIVPQRKKGPQYVQEVAPSSPEVGDTWYDSNLEKFMMYTTDNEWVEFEKIGGNPGSPYGYVCGGETLSVYFSTVDRFSFPFDSGTATHVGNLTQNSQGGSSCNSSNYGFIEHGAYSGSIQRTTVDRITFPFDSGVAVLIGNVVNTLYGSSACNSSIYGYFMGDNASTNIERITFPFDSGLSNIVGNLTDTRYISAACNSSNYGYICGGSFYDTSHHIRSFIDRITFPFDSGTSARVGNLDNSIGNMYGCNSSNYGYVCSGRDINLDFISSIERLTFPFDSGTATHVGNLTFTGSSIVSCNSTNYGYSCAGRDATVSLSVVERITFPFDSGTATHVGNLSLETDLGCSLDGTDFCTLFVD